MAGRPKMQALERQLANEFGGEDWVFDQIADGRPIKEIAARFGVSRPFFYRWRDVPAHRKRRRAKWAEAMRISAEAHAEDGFEELDELTKGRNGERRIPAPGEVQAVTGKSKYRQWLAAKRDPERFGDKGLELNFSIGALHLEALKASRPGALPAAGEDDGGGEDVATDSHIEDAEYELLGAGGDPITGGAGVAASERHGSGSLPAELGELV